MTETSFSCSANTIIEMPANSSLGDSFLRPEIVDRVQGVAAPSFRQRLSAAAGFAEMGGSLSSIVCIFLTVSGVPVPIWASVTAIGGSALCCGTAAFFHGCQDID